MSARFRELNFADVCAKQKRRGMTSPRRFCASVAAKNQAAISTPFKVLTSTGSASQAPILPRNAT